MIAVLFLAIFVGGLMIPSADMDEYASTAQPALDALGAGSVTVTFLGTSTLLFDDGKAGVLVDGFVTRPSKLRTAFSELSTDAAIVDRTLRRLGIEKLAGVVVVHSHYDHALDAACIAKRTGATLAGSRSTLRIGKGGNVAALKVFKNREPISFGDFIVTPIESRHSRPIPGLNDDLGHQIEEDLKQPAHARAYKEGGSYDLLIRHGDRTFLVKSSAAYVAGGPNEGLGGIKAEVLFLGTGRLGVQDPAEQEAYYQHTVGLVEPRIIVPIHWDDFTKPLSDNLEAMPVLFDDTGAGLDFIIRRAKADKRPVRVMQGFETMAMDGTISRKAAVEGGSEWSCE